MQIHLPPSAVTGILVAATAVHLMGSVYAAPILSVENTNDTMSGSPEGHHLQKRSLKDAECGVFAGITFFFPFLGAGIRLIDNKICDYTTHT